MGATEHLVIAIVSAVVAGVIVNLFARGVGGRPREDATITPRQRGPLRPWVWISTFIGGMASGLAVLVISLSINRSNGAESSVDPTQNAAETSSALPQARQIEQSRTEITKTAGEMPTNIRIEHPQNGQTVDMKLDKQTGSALLMAEGGLLLGDVAKNMRSSQVRLLVHPIVSPPAKGWWITEPVTLRGQGKWSGEVWYGDNENLKPKKGHELEIMAVLVDKADPNISSYSHIDTVEDVNLKAKSKPLRIKVGELSYRKTDK